jgi:UTP--glucose-1-phosphate uridylyltransferase
MMRINLKEFCNFDLSKEILEKYNTGIIGKVEPINVKEFPDINNPNIIDLTKDINFTISQNEYLNFIKKFDIPNKLILKTKDQITLNKDMLYTIGVHLFPFFSYGLLNGGSATSYADYKKNKDFNQVYFNSVDNLFSSLKETYINKPKGITPAYINPDKTPGASFIELKLRKLLIQALEYKKIAKKDSKNLFPVFQMTSHSTNSDIEMHLEKYKNSPYLKKLISETDINITNILTGIQPLITAYTHSSQGEVKDYFYNRENNMFYLPGGHGQCFMVLKDIFTNLYSKGIRFISIGNIDNIGYNLDPVELAIFALSEKNAAFDFSFKTQYDTKGGVLVVDNKDKLNCGDIGVAVSKELISNNKNKPILFNCASGLFNLEYLINNIDAITQNIPTRFSDQIKDIGKYSQAEQVTWEIIGILDSLIIFAINKYDRFLASKILLENFATSGIANRSLPKDLVNWSDDLHKGLINKLKELNLTLKDGKWTPQELI